MPPLNRCADASPPGCVIESVDAVVGVEVEGEAVAIVASAGEVAIQQQRLIQEVDHGVAVEVREQAMERESILAISGEGEVVEESQRNGAGSGDHVGIT